MTEKEIKEKIIDVVDAMSWDDKMTLWLQYMSDVVADNYEFKVAENKDNYYHSDYYPVLDLYVHKYRSQVELGGEKYKHKPATFDEFISNDCKAIESYVAGDFYHLKGIYYYYQKIAEKREINHKETIEMIRKVIKVMNETRDIMFRFTGIQYL